MAEKIYPIAIIALIISIITFVLGPAGILFALLSLVQGFYAKSKIKSNPELKGIGLAKAAIIISIISIIFNVALIFVIANIFGSIGLGNLDSPEDHCKFACERQEKTLVNTSYNPESKEATCVCYDAQTGNTNTVWTSLV